MHVLAFVFAALAAEAHPDLPPPGLPAPLDALEPVEFEAATVELELYLAPVDDTVPLRLAPVSDDRVVDQLERAAVRTPRPVQRRR